MLTTSEQYLDIERKAEFKSEYFDGETFTMPRVGRIHNLLAGGARASIDFAFRDRDCEVYSRDMRVCVSPSTGLYTYPDISAVCDEPSFLDNEFDTLLNPKLIIEVLLRSTETYDRGRKFQRYKGISSLARYVLIASERVQVEVFTLGEAGLWTPKIIIRHEDIIEISSIECSFTVADLYQKTGLLST